MTGSEAHGHDEHGDHPIPASLVALIIVGIFAAIFAAMTTKTFDQPVAVVTAIMAVWSLIALWVLDRD